MTIIPRASLVHRARYVTALAAMLLLPAAAAFAQGDRTPQTDQTVAAAKGMRLAVDNFAGDVVIRGWDRDSVRVQARHSPRIRVSVRSEASRIVVSASGGATAVDYDISVPTWMPVKVDGTYAFITVEGTAGEIAAETVRGDVSVKGGGTMVTLKSIQGEISIDGARGRIKASSVNEGITVVNASGDLELETTNGSIVMSRMDAGSVSADTVNGSVRFEGTASPQGHYRFSTHNGNILVGVPESASAAFSVRTYNGGMQTNLTLTGGNAADVRRGRRVVFTLGGGAADFELESFGGSIQIRRQGTLPAEKPKDKEPAPTPFP